MTISLLPASDVRPGDLLECPGTQVWKPVTAIEKQYGRLYFLMGTVSRSALVDELVAVGKV